MRRYIYIYIFFAVALMSCSQQSECDGAFRNVVAFYEEQGDTLKLRAAEYLQASAGYHYGIRRTIPADINGALFVHQV